MRSALSIPLYREINECHEAAGFSIRTDLPEFHLFSLDEIFPGTRQVMPPYWRGFYQVTYLESVGNTAMRLNDEEIVPNNHSLFFASPEHVLSWVRGKPERGFTLYFKAELLAGHARPIEETFPFFGRFALNALALEKADLATFRPQLERMHALFHSTHLYRRPQLAALTLAFLYDCRALFDRQRAPLAEPGENSNSALVTRFQQLVWQCSLGDRVVEDYAKCLNVSADHLGATIKERTGRNARDFIASRVILEAKRLLTYTDLNVNQIADHLQFSEPTHFARFFKRHTQRTPLEFRRGVIRSGPEPARNSAAGS